VAGISTWTMRKRSYFGALQAQGKMLRLNTLRYADELISVDPWFGGHSLVGKRIEKSGAN